MRHLSGFLLVIVLGPLLFSDPGLAQSQRTTASFLTFRSQPRIHALGEATVALDGYPGAIGVNPATIGKPGLLQGGTNVSSAPLLASDWRPALFDDLWVTSPSLSAQVGRVGVAAQVTYAQKTTEGVDRRGIIIGSDKQIRWAATVAGAYEFTPTLTGGASVRLIRQNILDRTETTPALDLGLHYARSYPYRQFSVRPSLGWSLTNVGPNVDFDEDLPGDLALPMKMQLGAAVDITSTFFPKDPPLVRLVLAGALAQPLNNFETKTTTLDNGETLLYFDADNPFEALFRSGWESRPGAAALDGTPPQLSVWEQTTRHVGAELRIQDIVALRWGRFHEDEQAGGRQFTTLGFGVDLYYVTLQRSWTVGEGPQESSFWRLTVQLPLTKNAPDPWLSLGL